MEKSLRPKARPKTLTSPRPVSRPVNIDMRKTGLTTSTKNNLVSGSVGTTPSTRGFVLDEIETGSVSGSGSTRGLPKK